MEQREVDAHFADTREEIRDRAIHGQVMTTHEIRSLHRLAAHVGTRAQQSIRAIPGAVLNSPRGDGDEDLPHGEAPYLSPFLVVASPQLHTQSRRSIYWIPRFPPRLGALAAKGSVPRHPPRLPWARPHRAPTAAQSGEA